MGGRTPGFRERMLESFPTIFSDLRYNAMCTLAVFFYAAGVKFVHLPTLRFRYK